MTASVSELNPILAGAVMRKTPLRNLREVCSRFGAGSAAKGLAYRLAQRLCKLQIGHVLSLHLGEVSSAGSPPAGLEYRWLTADDVRVCAADPANDLEASLAPRLENGHDYCFAAFDGPLLVNYSWYALDSIEPEHSLGVGLTFPPDTVYLYKAFTRPNYRGRGVHPAALRHATPFLAQRGISRLLALVEYASWPSLRSHEKLGCRHVGRFVKIGRQPIRFKRNPQLTETWGIRFGGKRYPH